MGNIDSNARLDAPVGEVYEYLSNPRNAPSYITAIKSVSGGPEGEPKKGDRYNAVAEFVGQTVYLTLHLGDLQPNKRVVLELHGDPEATISVDLKDLGNNQTQIRAELDVPAIPGFLLEVAMGGNMREGMQRLVTRFSGQ